jgi:hypothetical protein
MILLALIPVAVAVFWYGARQFSRERGGLRPHGRVLREHRRLRPQQWRETVARLEKHDPTPIAEAKAGPTRVQGVLSGASGDLGGKPGRECVWRNREGARPESAVAADLVFIADATGKCAIEGLEGGVVIAPAETLTVHHTSVSLYLGDEVEVCGTFAPDRVDDDADATKTVYGTLLADSGLDVRLVSRPRSEEPAPDDEPAPSPDDTRDRP